MICYLLGPGRAEALILGDAQSPPIASALSLVFSDSWHGSERPTQETDRGLDPAGGDQCRLGAGEIDSARAPLNAAFVVGAAPAGSLPGRIVRAARGRSLVMAGPISDRGEPGRRAKAPAQGHRKVG